jgi:uncharacterized protein involved in exopolysaccharide biosynthesis
MQESPSHIPSRLEDDSLDLRTYASLFMRHRTSIAIIVGVSAVLSVALAQWRGPRYTAEMLLGVSSMRTDRNERVADLASVATLLESQTVLAGLLNEFKLGEAPHWQTIASFRANALQIEPVANAEYLKVMVTLSDSELAAKVANGLGARVLALSQSVSVESVKRAREDLRKSLEETDERLKKAQVAYEQYRSSAQIELARTDLDFRLDQRGKLSGLLVDLETERARVADIRAEMAKRQRIGTLNQSIADNPTMVEAARQADPKVNPLSLQLRSEYVDEVYGQLERELTTRTANVAAFEKRKSELATVRKLDRPQLDELNRLYERETRLSQLEIERDLALRAYTEASDAYQGAQLKLAGRVPVIHVVDPALPPTDGMTQLVRAALLGAVAGLLLAVVMVLGRYALTPRP